MRRCIDDKDLGFTIIEMLVVVGIMGVIAALATPSLMGMYRRSTLKGEARKLYGAFAEAQGLAAASGNQHCLLFDRADRFWSIRVEQNGDGLCNNDDRVVSRSGVAANVAFGPQNGVDNGFRAPYNNIAYNAWCTPCGAAADRGAIFFDVDGRITDGDGDLVSGAVMMHDAGGGSDELVQALVFVGATGDVRLFNALE